MCEIGLADFRRGGRMMFLIKNCCDWNNACGWLKKAL